MCLLIVKYTAHIFIVESYYRHSMRTEDRSTTTDGKDSVSTVVRSFVVQGHPIPYLVCTQEGLFLSCTE
jgi:hypothetical protein